MSEKYAKIIALDFDGCLVTNKYPEVGEPIIKNVKKIKEEITNGARVILWTNRVDKYLDAAVDFCTDQGIYLDAVNENLPEVIAEFGSNTRKIFANEYWDDRAILMCEKDIGEFSDGYHTFEDLYRERLMLSATLFNTYKERTWKSCRHSDGKVCFHGNWFIVGIETPEGQYTYHYEMKYWYLFDCEIFNQAPAWDGHTDKDVNRLVSLTQERTVPEEQKVCCESKTACKDIFMKTSNMQSWAEREIAIAYKYERAGNKTPDDEWDYGCACYESALKAFKALMGHGHSGFSIGITKHILNRLIDGKPLTPIEDTPDSWSDISDMSGLKGEEVNYQCRRMSALFKYVYADGSVKYKNIDSHYCIDINNKSTYHSSLVQKIMDEMYPITMPYLPSEPIKVYCQDLLTDRKNGDFDTVGVFYAIKPDDERIEINRFFKESKGDSDTGWDEINVEEYEQRKELELKRLWEEKPSE